MPNCEKRKSAASEAPSIETRFAVANVNKERTPEKPGNGIAVEPWTCHTRDPLVGSERLTRTTTRTRNSTPHR